MVNLFFMKVSSYFIKETILFSTNGAGRTGYKHAKSVFELFLHNYAQKLTQN